MDYQLILFDLDNTLFDFSRSERHSFKLTLEKVSYTGNFEDALKIYKKHSRSLWPQLEKGKISIRFLRVERFRLAFEELGIVYSSEEADLFYLDQLVENVFMIDGALELCEHLKNKDLVIGAVTNGIKRVQHQRMKKVGLDSIFDFILTSEECPHAKPHPSIFQRALNKCSYDGPLNKVLMIGDNLVADIQGAGNFGFDTCWFNPGERENHLGLEPTFTETSLQQVTSKFR